MKLSNTGLQLIKEFEGVRLRAYKDAVGVWTIGYGHTKSVTPGMHITMERAEQLLKEDLDIFEKGVENLVQVPLNQNQFDALVSFAFNVGLGALGRSTLLRYLNKGQYATASKEFPRWNKAGGRVLKGLTRRREAEMDLFLTSVVEVSDTVSVEDPDLEVIEPINDMPTIWPVKGQNIYPNTIALVLLEEYFEHDITPSFIEVLQAKNNLKQDGIIGPVTWKTLLSNTAVL